MGKLIVLIVSIVMPQNMPDVQKAIPMPSFEVCWEAAKDYLNHDLTDEMRGRGAQGLMAGCAYRDAPTQEN